MKLIVGLRNFANAPKNTPDNYNMEAGVLGTYVWNSTTAPVHDRSACRLDLTVCVCSLSCCWQGIVLLTFIYEFNPYHTRRFRHTDISWGRIACCCYCWLALSGGSLLICVMRLPERRDRRALLRFQSILSYVCEGIHFQTDRSSSVP